jgi:signal transduction histidine kinase
VKIRLGTLLIAACVTAAALPVLFIEAVNYWQRAEVRPDFWVQRGWLMAAVGALGVALATAVGRWLAGVLTRPLTGLLEASERLARGENDARISAPRGLAPVEVLQLLDRFNHLADHLLDTHDALVDAKADLEQRVAQRTQELAQRNVDLGYSRSTLYAVMESMNDGVILITPDRRIRYINRNTESLLRLEEAFYPGRPADALYSAIAKVCAAPGVNCEQLEGAAAGEALPAVLTVESGGDTYRYLQWRTFPIRNATGANLGLGHIVTDVTQAHELDRVKSEVISTVSHELRTPLTAIRASVSSLLRQDVEWDEETRQDFLLTIRDESRHLQELIQNVLDMSKIEAGVLRLEPYPMQVDELVEGVVSRVRPLHPDWTLTLRMPAALPAVNIDRRRMEQVLLNLVDNAVKYAAQSREIIISAWQEAGEVWLSVRDEGIGIPPEHVELIFQRFHRVDSKLTRNTGGSGLGLAISRGLVEAHGGRIWVESALGQGSTFYIALPVAQEGNPV